MKLENKVTKEYASWKGSGGEREELIGDGTTAGVLLKDNDDIAHTFRNQLMGSLASLHRFLFVNKSSVYICYKQIRALKSASQAKGPSNKARIKVCRVANSHFAPGRLKASGVVSYQERCKGVRGIERGIPTATEFHKKKQNTFDV